VIAHAPKACSAPPRSGYAKHLKHRLASGSRSVQPLLVKEKTDTLFMKALENAEKVGNPRAVNWTLGTLAEEIADGCANYGDATGFARALDRDLDWPELMALAELKRAKLN
jgi:hypothetical protein